MRLAVEWHSPPAPGSSPDDRGLLSGRPRSPLLFPILDVHPLPARRERAVGGAGMSHDDRSRCASTATTIAPAITILVMPSGMLCAMRVKRKSWMIIAPMKVPRIVARPPKPDPPEIR